MFIAVDGNGRPISIDEVNDRDNYYCPDCNQLLTIRRGKIRLHHFAHRKGSVECTDTWRAKKIYDVPNTWHKDWQSFFPVVNREIQLSFGAVKHRGDVVTGRTVIEFQHTPISNKPFDERNNYYHSCDCKVIWLFDFIEAFSNGDLVVRNDGYYIWDSFKRTFRFLDETRGQVEIFFQIMDGGKCIIQVEPGEIINSHNYFKPVKALTKEEFLKYLSQKEDGSFALPDLGTIDQDPAYQSFKEEYDIILDSQQERALQHSDGATLLTAVPGSGKTTTLVARLGYMVTRKGIDPSSILALTYTNAAADKMRQDYISKFGEETGNLINFSTINSFCNKIAKSYIPNVSIADEKQRKTILRSLYTSINHDKPTESDMVSLETEISYVKNAMVPQEDFGNYNWQARGFAEIYEQYQSELKRRNTIDFDDQMVVALACLKSNPDTLKTYQQKYQHICVDEAQDTSKIQHVIIKLLAGENNNIFMVGDEDQSVYGYRGAYPQALLEFKHTYGNPFILNLETNYRSTSEIVDAANKIIERNPNRMLKRMVSARGKGGTVSYADVDERIDQISFLVESCKDTKTETAVIYRNNETAVPIIDAFERNGIPYYLNKATELFFTNRLLTDIMTFFRFSLDPENQNLFMDCYYKLHMYFKKDRADNACYWSGRKHTKLLDEFIEQNKYLKGYKYTAIQQQMERAERFGRIILHLKDMKPAEAIDLLINSGYDEYADEKLIDLSAAEEMKNIAENCDTITDFINRIEQLESIVKQKMVNSERKEEDIVISTIHSCKGMEFEKVIIVDAVDGILPSRKSRYLRNEDKFITLAEERRLFYVACTRAKNELVIIKIENEEQEFVSNLLSNPECDCIYKKKKKPMIPEIKINEPDTIQKLTELFGKDGFTIVDTESPSIEINKSEPEPVITRAVSWFTIDQLWEMRDPQQYMIVQSNQNKKYKIIRTKSSYYGDWYAQDYNENSNGELVEIDNADEPIWGCLFDK